jgi:hypothetical protein
VCGPRASNVRKNGRTLRINEIGLRRCLLLNTMRTTGETTAYISSAVSSVGTPLPGTGLAFRRDNAASTVLLSRFIQVIVRAASSRSACSCALSYRQKLASVTAVKSLAHVIGHLRPDAVAPYALASTGSTFPAPWSSW